MNKESELLKKKLAREQAAREEAEQLLEKKSLELFYSNEKLKELNVNLEDLVEERTQKLNETQLDYQTMVESINDMIFRLDLQGNILFNNQIAQKIIGVENEDLKGRNILSFIDPGERSLVFIHFARQFLSRSCINYYDISIKTRFEKRIWLRLNVQFSSPSCSFCLRKQQALVSDQQEVRAENNCSFNEIIIVAHDITQRKLGQEKLEKSEKKYRELTESLPELICELDERGTLTYANKFAIEKFGYSAEEVLNGKLNILDIFPDDLRSTVERNLKIIYRIKKAISVEYYAKKKNGEVFPVIVYTAPILEQDKVVGLRGVMFDITTRIEHEKEIAHNLRQQEILSKISMNYNSLERFEIKTSEALRTIGEHIGVSRVYIFENAEDGESTSNTYEWCNKGVESQIDELQDIPYSAIPSWKELLETEGIVYSENIDDLPKDIYDILAPQEIKSIIVLPLIAQNKIFGFIGFDECNSNHKWTKSEIELLRIVSNIFSNNFLRHTVQGELIESERENRIIINSIPDVIIHVNKTGEIKALKAAQTSNLTNLIKDENSPAISEAFNTKLASLFNEAILKCLKSNEHQFEFKNLNWDEVEYYEARLVKLNAEEVLIIIRDVSVIKKNEKQLEIAKNKAEEASKMKSEFLANISHEIRTPLNAILGFSQWLFENTETSQHKGYLTTIISSGRNLLDIINDILDISKLESGNIDIDWNPMSFNEVISDLKMVFKDNVNEKGLSMKFTIEESVPDFIIMDELRFYQILFNILGNAVKFTEKGYVHLIAFAVETGKKDEINLMVNIEDTGIGIDETKQKQIFDAFTQQSGQSNRSYDGTGLGLAIVNGLLKKLNGSIQVNSKPGKGSNFKLVFNNIKVDRTDRVKVQLKESSPNMKLGPCSVMIVDDIDYNITVLKALINSEHVNYIEALDGTSALFKLRSEKPDIIFMDIRMPGLDGFAVTKIIKEDVRLKDIPVIAFSASTIKTKSELIKLLFDDFLQKPVFKKEVENILMKHLPQFYKYYEEDKSIEEAEIEILHEEELDNQHIIIDKLENVYLEKWEKIKDGLVIYEIEEFKEELKIFAGETKSDVVSKYCTELEVGLQSFDIELIEKKLKTFPNLIEKLKALQK